MKFWLYLTGSLFILAVYSCEYNTKEIFKRDLNKNTNAPDIQVVDLDLSQEKDTVELLYNRVYFNFKSSNQSIRWVKFYLNDLLIGKVESGNSYFDMSYDFLYSGYHRLKLEIFTSSGTGSIADAVEAEGYLFATKTWIIKVVGANYLTVTTTSENGFLKLRWPKSYASVSEYIIYKSNFEIGRTSENEFIDKGYVGEGAEYFVRFMENGRLTDYGWVTLPKEINFKFNTDINNNYSIYWGRLKYYAAVDSIILIGADEDYRRLMQSSTDTSISGFPVSTSFFGQYRQFQLVLLPKYNNPFNDHSYQVYNIFGSNIFHTMIGDSAPMFDWFGRLSNNEFLYHTDQYSYHGTAYNDSIFRYSAKENKIQERIRYNPPDYNWTGDHYWNLTISPDGKYFLAHAGLSGTAVYTSSYDFQNYVISDINSMTMGSSVKMPVSNNGIGIISGGSGICLYDFKNKRLMHSMNENSVFSNDNISSDGKYFFISFGFSVYLYDSTMNMLATINPWPASEFDYFNFIPSSPEQAVAWSTDTKSLKFFNLPGLQTVKEFTVDEDKILDIDYSNKHILSFSPNLLVVRSLDDGNILYQIPCGIQNAFTGQCCLLGNSIFYYHGSRYYLN